LRDRDVIRAAVRNQVSWMEGVSRVMGGGVHRVGPLRVVFTGSKKVTVPFPWRVSGPALDALIAWCGERGVRGIAVWASGLGPVDALDAQLRERGFCEGWRPHWMAASAEDLVAPDDPRAEVVDAVPEYDGFGQTLLGLADGRRFWHVAARVDGVYAGHAWSHRVGDCAGLYDVDVRPLFQRQGLGRAMTVAAVRAAGAPLVVLNATGEGEALYRALGFRSVGLGWTWWWDDARGAQP
jgi:GNAT superfamily N-acetyltransferase